MIEGLRIDKILNIRRSYDILILRSQPLEVAICDLKIKRRNIMGNEKKLENPIIPSGNIEIRNAIHLVRGRQVMLDFDLAMLYQVETKRLNERVKRNQNRFPESFCFQLTKEEFDDLRSQSATSSDEYGGRRYRPYAFTEQGIAMLSSVLNSDVAIDISIKIMDTFVEMRKFIASNSQLFERISSIELRQLEYQIVFFVSFVIIISACIIPLFHPHKNPTRVAAPTKLVYLCRFPLVEDCATLSYNIHRNHIDYFLSSGGELCL